MYTYTPIYRCIYTHLFKYVNIHNCQPSESKRGDAYSYIHTYTLIHSVYMYTYLHINTYIPARLRNQLLGQVSPISDAATHRNTPQHTATHRNALRHSATLCKERCIFSKEPLHKFSNEPCINFEMSLIFIHTCQASESEGGDT